MNSNYCWSSSTTPLSRPNRSSVSPVDFTKIENLIAKSDEEQRRHQHQNVMQYWNSTTQHYMFPYYNVVPFLYPPLVSYKLYNSFYTAPFVCYPKSQPGDSFGKTRTKSTKTKIWCSEWSPEETEIMTSEFEKDDRVTLYRAKDLAELVNKTRKQVITWFNNRRNEQNREQPEAEKQQKQKKGDSMIKPQNQARVRFTPEQLVILNKVFNKQDTINEKEAEELAKQITNKAPLQIKEWFHGQRKRERDAEKQRVQ